MDRARFLIAGDACCEVQGYVDAGGDPRSRHDLAIAHDTLGDQGYPIARAVADYTAVVIDEERNVATCVRSAAAETALGELMRGILSLEGAEPERDAAMNALLASFRDLRQTRATRIHIAATHSDPYKWATVVVLGIVTQIALGIHERPLADPQLTAMSSLYHGGITNQSP